VRRAAPLVAAAFLLAGCGGGAKKAAPCGSATKTDPGGTAISALVVAAGAHDTGRLWSLLSSPTQARYGSTENGARAIERALVPYSREGCRLEVSERITDRFGVVAIVDKQGGAFALPLRLQKGNWKAELGGPVQIQHLGLPAPGGRAKLVVQLAVEVKSLAHEIDAAVMYLDGRAAASTGHGSPNDETLLVNLPAPLPRGRHVAVAFASAGGDASALAWSFTVTR
jgi:hypothetical protein